MRREIDHLHADQSDQLIAEAQKSPNLAVIWQLTTPSPLLPAGFEQTGPDFGALGQKFRVFQWKPPAFQ
jgi:hypothetical protein